MLHEKGIAHRDLKLSNVLINDDYDIKIADFGLAKLEANGDLFKSYCGTPFAMAPEILCKEKYDIKCDTWSLGVMLYQLAFGKLPFDATKYGGGVMGLKKAVTKDEPLFDLPTI
jgi:serine/threonine-protein kinase GIN4